MPELKNDEGLVIARINLVHMTLSGPPLVGVSLGHGATQETLLTRREAIELAYTLMAAAGPPSD